MSLQDIAITAVLASTIGFSNIAQAPTNSQEPIPQKQSERTSVKNHTLDDLIGSDKMELINPTENPKYFILNEGNPEWCIPCRIADPMFREELIPKYQDLMDNELGFPTIQFAHFNVGDKEGPFIRATEITGVPAFSVWEYTNSWTIKPDSVTNNYNEFVTNLPKFIPDSKVYEGNQQQLLDKTIAKALIPQGILPVQYNTKSRLIRGESDKESNTGQLLHLLETLPEDAIWYEQIAGTRDGAFSTILNLNNPDQLYSAINGHHPLPQNTSMRGRTVLEDFGRDIRKALWEEAIYNPEKNPEKGIYIDTEKTGLGPLISFMSSLNAESKEIIKEDYPSLDLQRITDEGRLSEIVFQEDDNYNITQGSLDISNLVVILDRFEYDRRFFALENEDPSITSSPERLQEIMKYKEALISARDNAMTEQIPEQYRNFVTNYFEAMPISFGARFPSEERLISRLDNLEIPERDHSFEEYRSELLEARNAIEDAHNRGQKAGIQIYHPNGDPKTIEEQLSSKQDSLVVTYNSFNLESSIKTINQLSYVKENNPDIGVLLIDVPNKGIVPYLPTNIGSGTAEIRGALRHSEDNNRRYILYKGGKPVDFGKLPEKTEELLDSTEF